MLTASKAVPREYRFRERRAYAAVPCWRSLGRRSFKPRSSRPAAAGEDQISISVEELDRGAILEAVGAGEMDVGGDYPRPSKGAVFVIDVRYIVEGVILTTRLALPETSLGGVERARTGRVGVGGQGAVAVKGH